MSSTVGALFVDGDRAVEKLVETVQQVATDTRENWSSMAQDVWFRRSRESGRNDLGGGAHVNSGLDRADAGVLAGRTEIGSINGFLVEAGASLGVATPENARLVEQVQDRIRSTEIF